MSDAKKDDLAERVTQFDLLRLPGQPMMMHMGTSYLIHDLWDEVLRLRKELRGHEQFAASVNEALNSGDGVYRP